MKYFRILFLSIVIALLFPIQAQCRNVVVVIDPGHGGDALGGNMDDRIERDINLITAQAFRDRLKMYEGVDVYITRENNTDPDIDRKARFKIATKNNADLFCSVHYNMSEYHSLYGTEVWTPMTGTNYAKSMEFATILNNDLANLGLFNRGIKHREASDGSEYYGILKYGLDNNIPSVIIEHCHLDNPNDSAFWNEEAYKQFGYTDADAVAKYFRLSSSQLGIDYSNYDRVAFEVPSQAVRADKTEPEYCILSLDGYDEGNMTANITVNAADSDGYIQYYSLSYDGGNTYGELLPWDNRDSEVLHTVIELKEQTNEQLRCTVYNQYELCNESEVVNLPYIEAAVMDKIDNIDEGTYVVEKEENKENNNKNIVLVVVAILVLLALIMISIIIVRLIYESRRRKRRRKNKKKKNAP